MKLSFYCTSWGQDHLPWDAFCKKAKDEGFDGVETTVPATLEEQYPVVNGLLKHGLRLIGQHWDTGNTDFESHAIQHEKRLLSMLSANSVLMTSHTGKDYFTAEQNKYLLQISEKIAIENDVTIIHETHRGKFSFAAHVTKRFLEDLPWLRLTLDISHWYAVAESYLEDQAEAVDLALSRTAHIHARIGYTQGPQVTDPRAPEWQPALEQHLKHWDKVVQMKADAGAEHLGFTCEFGPPPYMPCIPFTRKPVVDQWEVNAWMMNFLKERYKAYI